MRRDEEWYTCMVKDQFTKVVLTSSVRQPEVTGPLSLFDNTIRKEHHL